MNISEFIKTTPLRTRILDPEYAKKHSRIMGKRQARDQTKIMRVAKRQRELQKNKGFPNVRQLFKSEGINMLKDDLEHIIHGCNEHCGCGRPKKEKKVDEQAFADPGVGDVSQKMLARQGLVTPRKITPAAPQQTTAQKTAALNKAAAGWDAERKAKMAALPPDVLARKKAREAQAAAQKAQAAAPPPAPATVPPPRQVQNMRRPVPSAAATPQSPVAIRTAPQPTRPVNVSDRVRGQGISPRPLRSRI
jgi:hypothetical protein